MKKTFFSLFALSALLLSGCNEEVQVNANYEPTPVIFGLLDQSENIHMIKINRGFVGPGDAFSFAQIPDSNYFDNKPTLNTTLDSGEIKVLDEYNIISTTPNLDDTRPDFRFSKTKKNIKFKKLFKSGLSLLENSFAYLGSDSF